MGVTALRGVGSMPSFVIWLVLNQRRNSAMATTNTSVPAYSCTRWEKTCFSSLVMSLYRFIAGYMPPGFRQKESRTGSYMVRSWVGWPSIARTKSMGSAVFSANMP